MKKCWPTEAGSLFTLSSLLKGRPAAGKAEGDEVLICLGPDEPAEVLDTRRTFAVEFSKTSAV